MEKRMRCALLPMALAVFFCLPVNALFATQGPTPRFDSLNSEVQKLIYETRFSDAHSYVRESIEGENLTSEEQYYLDFFVGDVYRAAGQEHLALKHYEKAEKFLDAFGENRYFEALLTLRRAECHFNREQYEAACSYALSATNEGLRDVLSPQSMAVAKLILGYCSFKNENYRDALEYFRGAENNYRSAGLMCELPLAAIKIAEIHLHTGRYDEMHAALDRAEALVDSCDIAMYRVLLYRTQIYIYEKRKLFREALSKMKELGEVNEQFEFEIQRKQIEVLENRIEDAEKETLKQINARNEDVLKEKQLTLNIALVCVLLLGVLVFFLIRVSRQRVKAAQAIAKLNTELEVKVRDRTHNLEKANRRITAHAEKLKEKNAQMLDFCNIISHNFRGPLSNMVALTELLEDARNEEERNSYVKHFKPVIFGLNETCNELFESLQVVQDPAVTEGAVSFLTAFKKTRRSLQATISDSEAEIIADFAEAPEVICPHMYLESIIHNLISNAIKYRSPDRKPVIEVKSTRADAEVVLSVKDNGLGLDLNRHGNALFKMRRVFHDHPEAKGFGLFLTKAQVETIGGRIWAESKPEAGSVFFVAFPDQTAST